MPDNDDNNPFEIKKVTIRPLTAGESRLAARGTGTIPTEYTYHCTFGDCQGTDNGDACASGNPDACPTIVQDQCPSDPYWCGDSYLTGACQC